MTRMIEVKVAELSGAALDYAVAQATKAWEWAHEWFPTMTLDPTFKGVEAFEFNGGRKVCRLVPRNAFRQEYEIFNPSTDWSQGGPLIDNYKVGVVHAKGYFSDEKWHATMIGGATQVGVTPLIAVCRAIVAAKLGPAVSVPAELVRGVDL